MLSYWQKNFYIHSYDVAIIGAGINGLLTAIRLKQLSPTLKVAIFEKGTMSDGATIRNAGFACFGSISELEDDLSLSDINSVLQVLKNRFEGLSILRDLVGDDAMRFHPSGGYELFTADEYHQFQACSERINFWNKEVNNVCGINNTFQVYSKPSENLGFSDSSKLILNSYEGSIHSNYLVYALHSMARKYDIPVFFGMELSKYSHDSHKIDLFFHSEQQVETKKLLFCTNGYLPQLMGLEDVNPARGQVLITQPIPGLKLKGVFHHQSGYNYFRDLDGRVLLGGGRFLDFEGETITEHKLNEKIQDYLEGLLYSAIIPNINVKIEMRWSGIMAMGKNKSPIVKEIEDNVFYAGRMGGMGVALSAHTSLEAAHLLIKSL